MVHYYTGLNKPHKRPLIYELFLSIQNILVLKLSISVLPYMEIKLDSCFWFLLLLCYDAFMKQYFILFHFSLGTHGTVLAESRREKRARNW